MFWWTGRKEVGTKFGSLHSESLRVELAFGLSLHADYMLGQSEIILCEVVVV